MNTRIIEIWVGLFVVGGLAALFMLAMSVSNLTDFDSSKGYKVVARFENIGGLKVRSLVSASGVRVGRVTDIRYDNTGFEAEVTMTLEPQYVFPKDTSASIYTAGLLGEQYIGLQPGGEEENLKEGDRVALTESAMVLERLISQFLYNKASGDSE
ncbi:MAG: outer membrane lipid asymmetry maintenance protein MlaD [Gammaproteobacteria bacterium]|nr:outer membrane lipid asymmetry maintenance protein MlaD [Gammaproteobacteria bacterium]